MTKIIPQDIVPPEKRSIRDIPLPKRVNRAQNQDISRPVFTSSETDESHSFESPKVYPYENEPRSSFFHKKSIWIASGIALVIVLFAVSSLFAGATVTVTPKEEVISASASKVLTAKQVPETGDMEYSVITVSKDLGKSVPVSGEEHVEIKASGKITIFNTFDSNSQRLIKNTRFETPEGLIYRINESVVVPGRTGTGAQMSPGSVDVTVYADEAGAKYNVELKDFTIPGFKNDPRFKAIYARSKTNMAGGFVGNINKVSESDLAAAKKELQDNLKNELKKEAISQAPVDFILYDGGMTFSFESLPQTDPKSSSVTVNERGVLRSVLFNRKKLSQFLVEKLEARLPEGEVWIANLPDITMSIQNSESFNPSEDKEFTFVMQGDVKFVSQFDEEKIKNSLLGKSKNDLESVMANFPTVLKANAVVRPFWKRSFPTDAKDIQIKTVLTKTQ